MNDTLPWMPRLEDSATFLGKPVSYWLNLEQELLRKINTVELPDRSFRTLRVVCDSFVPPELVDKLAKVEVRNYIGPVTAIRVIGGEVMQLRFEMNVIDVQSKKPVNLQVFGGHIDRYYNDGILRMIREGLRFCVLHELDECLLYDGKFVNDPHPQIKLPPFI
jgi:hypothetical protein